MCIKKPEFDADIETVKKAAKILLRKKWSAKKWQNNGVFAFYYFVQKFSAYIFFFSIEFCIL